MRFRSMLVLALVASALTVSVRADDLARRRIEASVRFLAGDLLEGRGTPSRGLDLAALYLANELRAAGWEPASGGSYLQEYALKEYAPAEAHITVKLNGRALRSDEYVLKVMATGPTAISGRYDAVFAGYGIVSPERGRDDLAGVDVRGKAVIAILGAPWKVDPEALSECDHVIGKRLQAGIRNASAVVYVSEELESPPDEPASPEVAFIRSMARVPVAYLAQQSPKRTFAMPPVGLFVTPRAFDRTLAQACGGTYAEWRKRLADGTGGKAKAVPASVEIGVEVQPRDGRAANVVAVLRGTDPALRDEWVVLSAHYDHLGRMDARVDQDGIFNGADDNASGTAAALEVARLLRAGPPLRRSVLVLLTSGEECGLLGSGYYSFNPLVPRESVVANVNLDMIGRSDGSVIAIADVAEDLYRTATEIGDAGGIKIEPDPNPTWRLLYRVDSYHFARQGVPAIEFFTNMHEDYHQPSDTADLIHYDQLARITNAVHRLLDHYAQGGARPTFKRPSWFLVPD